MYDRHTTVVQCDIPFCIGSSDYNRAYYERYDTLELFSCGRLFMQITTIIVRLYRQKQLL
jgi:hypothetical protein